MEIQECSSSSEKKKVRNDGFYPLEDCDFTLRIRLLLTKMMKVVKRIRLTKTIPTRSHFLMNMTMSLMVMRK